MKKKCYACGMKFDKKQLKFLNNKENVEKLKSRCLLELVEKVKVCYNCARYLK